MTKRNNSDAIKQFVIWKNKQKSYLIQNILSKWIHKEKNSRGRYTNGDKKYEKYAYVPGLQSKNETKTHIFFLIISWQERGRNVRCDDVDHWATLVKLLIQNWI